MIEHLPPNARLLHQTEIADDLMVESPIVIAMDAYGIVSLSQEGRHIVINRGSIKELRRELRRLETHPLETQ